jgi:hypothetical protein
MGNTLLATATYFLRIVGRKEWDELMRRRYFDLPGSANPISWAIAILIWSLIVGAVWLGTLFAFFSLGVLIFEWIR